MAALLTRMAARGGALVSRLHRRSTEILNKQGIMNRPQIIHFRTERAEWLITGGNPTITCNNTPEVDRFHYLLNWGNFATWDLLIVLNKLMTWVGYRLSIPQSILRIMGPQSIIRDCKLQQHNALRAVLTATEEKLISTELWNTTFAFIIISVVPKWK